MMTTVFAELPPLSFDLIAADPPWRFRTWGEHNQTKSASRHYDLMTTDDIKELPVGGLAQRDCLLMLWATGAMLPQALDVMAAWGFKYKSLMSWRKMTPAGKVRMGTGYWTRSMHEPILLGTLGNPTKVSGFPSIFDGIAREHSRKPDEFFDLVEKHTTGLRRLELFSRESRPNWTAWGNETGKLDEGSTHDLPDPK
jgi:N6-adenosine-specific RNA methylase IME4